MKGHDPVSDIHDDPGGWRPAPRYPDPAVVSLDPRFDSYRLPLAKVERLATGCRWAEGPVYFGDLRCLLWSDVPNNRIMRWDEVTGRSGLRRAVRFRQRQDARPAGAAADLRTRRAPRHAHRVRRGDHGAWPTGSRASGSIRRTTSSVKSDGTIWFTDPTFGIVRVRRPQGGAGLGPNVYRIDPGGARSRSSPKASPGPTGSRSLPTRRCSTSSSRAAFPPARSSPTTSAAASRSPTGAC